MALIVSSAVSASGEGTIVLKTQKGSEIAFYGFLRTDAVYDTSRMNDTQIPVYVLSEDSKALLPSTTTGMPLGIGAEENRNDFTLHPRLTRFGFNLKGGNVDGLGSAALTGRLEIDFYAFPSSDSRNMIRMRHAYLSLGWGNFSLLTGQTSDLISPRFPGVNADMVMWGAGNLADRRPQVRAVYSLPIGKTRLLLQVMAGLTGANAGQDLDSNGLLDGESSGLPTLQGRVAYQLPLWDSQSLEVGVWGHSASEEIDTALAGKTEFQSQVIGIDVQLPLYKDRLVLTAEGWSGSNLNDVRGGILQGINTATGEEINAVGGFAQLSVTLANRATYKNTLHFGVSLDDPDEEDLNLGGRDLNTVFYVADKATFGPVLIGLEYLNWTTEYKGFGDGHNDRFKLYTAYNF